MVEERGEGKKRQTPLRAIINIIALQHRIDQLKPRSRLTRGRQIRMVSDDWRELRH
jgi:hypothetical protein